MSLFFVNCERTILFSVKRDLDPPFTTLIFGEHGIITHNYYTMMAKPIGALELHYPMI